MVGKCFWKFFFGVLTCSQQKSFLGLSKAVRQSRAVQIHMNIHSYKSPGFDIFNQDIFSFRFLHGNYFWFFPFWLSFEHFFRSLVSSHFWQLTWLQRWMPETRTLLDGLSDSNQHGNTAPMVPPQTASQSVCRHICLKRRFRMWKLCFYRYYRPRVICDASLRQTKA